MYQYCLYNMTVASPFPIPYLDPLQVKIHKADVYIEKGKLPLIKAPVLKEDNWSKLYKEEYVCKITENLSFYVGYGKHIIIEEKPGQNKEVTYLYLLGHILGVIFCQRGMLAIHSSSIVIRDKAIILCGARGVGKSTLSMLLSQKGYKLLSDDISVLQIQQEGTVVACRGMPEQKICPDLAERLAVNIEDCQHIQLDKEKYVMQDPSKFGYKNTRVAAFIELGVNQDKHITQTMITGKEKLIGIIRNIYRLYIMYQMGVPRDYMQQLIHIATKIPYYQIKRPLEGFSGFELIERIEACIDEEKGSCVNEKDGIK